MKSADLRARLIGGAPLLVVTLFGLWLLWPVPAGVMPLSADHTVHLTRAYLYGQQLAGGHLVGWSPAWFFGFPLGELYPVLGDLGVVALRVLSLGLLDWPQAYALLFTLVFLAQGWVLLRCGRAIGWGPLPGLVAALLALADAGAYREGGWIYTVLYGVWPQTLATSLAWLAFAELARARVPALPVLSVSPTEPLPSPARDGPGRPLARAALAAAGALLAHPMALMMLALGAPLYLFTVGLRRQDRLAPPRRELFAGAALQLLIALGLGLALAAWWWLPMSAHRGWMASYGWLHAPLADMLRWAAGGQWAQLMPPAVGYSALLGLLAAACLGRATLRFFALWTVLHWLLASTDAFWSLRLDWLSAGFTHIQYQRFLIAAKPGIFLLAGAAVGGLVHLAQGTWPRRHATRVRVHSTLPAAPRAGAPRRPVPRPLRRALALASAGAALALALWQAVAARGSVQRHHVGAVQTARFPDKTGPAVADADYAAFLAWARERWTTREADYRLAVRADRNAHWFMDSPVTTGTPTYKQGFTPGDNFVHKPESGDPALLRRLGVRYVLATGGAGPPGTALAAEFGALRVFEFPDVEPLAHLEPGPAGPAYPGSVHVERADLTAGLVRVRVTGSAPGARLVLHVAGYPRWDLSFQPADGAAAEAVEWFEAPVIGDGPIATQDDRRAGRLRGGKALGDDGREPTLIAAPARDGVYELRYVRWRRADMLGLLLGLGGLVALVVLVRARQPLPRVHLLLHRLARPAIVAPLLVLLLAVGVVRWRGGAAREHDLASARLLRGEASGSMRAGPLKTDMQIFPAVLAKPDRSGMSEEIFNNVALGDTLAGWYAVDDDDAKQRRRGSHRLTVSAGPAGAGAFTTLLDVQVPHRPDRRLLDSVPVPPDLRAVPVDVKIVVTTSGEQPPRFGLDLRLAYL